MCAALLLSAALLSGCADGGNGGGAGGGSGSGALDLDAVAQDEAVEVLLPSADGVVQYDAAGGTVDVSNASLGYIMVADDAATKRKLRISCGDAVYTYDLAPGAGFDAFPLQSGSGSYEIRIYEQVEGDMYSAVFYLPLEVAVEDENYAYLIPSRTVDYTGASLCVKASERLAAASAGERETVKTLFSYVARYVAYDYDKAETVEGGYIPEPDATLVSGKGICYDYSSLLAAMLRAQGIPTKLVVGYISSGEYHAWNAVCIGGKWVLYDATFDKSEAKEGGYAESKHY